MATGRVPFLKETGREVGVDRACNGGTTALVRANEAAAPRILSLQIAGGDKILDAWADIVALLYVRHVRHIVEQ